MDKVVERQTSLDLSGLPKHVTTLVEDTILNVSLSTPTEREYDWTKSPGEQLIDSFFECLERRQKAWQEQRVAPSQMFYETLEIKSLTLSPALRGVELRDLMLPYLFTDFELRKTVPYTQRKLLDIYGRSPELAREIVDQSIVGAHGTRSGSLVNILQHGLRPTDYQRENQLLSLTGTYDWDGNNFNRVATSQCLWWNDRTIARYTHRPAVNVANLAGWMEAYAEEWDAPDLKPTRKLVLSWAKRLSDFKNKTNKSDVETDIESCLNADFPVIVLVDDQTLSKRNAHRVQSDERDEFAIDGGLPPINIPTILVPSKDINLVRRLGDKYSWYGSIYDIGSYYDLMELEI